LFEVDVKLGPTLEIGSPQQLFQHPGVADGVNISAYPRYDVSADGERFVVFQSLPDNQPKIRIVQNWFEEFRDRTPAL
jgi:hypothetical protein